MKGEPDLAIEGALPTFWPEPVNSRGYNMGNFASRSQYQIQPHISGDCPKNRLKQSQFTKTTIIAQNKEMLRS